MEPRGRAAQALSDRPRALTTSRIREAAACVFLLGLAMIQSPGLLVSDTKFDLAVAPAKFLARAGHLWDPMGALGQLQNQAYGYLFPMGPFFLLGSALDIPGWATQRLWMALVLCVAMLGAVRVARALGVRSDLACLVAGFAYALSPRMLTTLGPISIEAWPSALAPWVLLPLVHGAQRGSPRRAAALSAVAVAMVGGVNAAATFAVLPLGVVWLLTRTPGPRRRAMMLWWPVFTLLGTLWWLVPLFALGAYSPPFLDFIETTSVTTFPTTLFDVLRGTSNWVPYVDPGSRAGTDLLTTPFLVLDGGVMLMLGFVGLLDRRNPHRVFLTLSVLVGVLMVAAGHQGAVHGWFAGDIRGLLDGVLAPLRNVHKFDPVLRLPLTVAAALALDRFLGTRPVTSDVLVRVQRVAFLGMILVAFLGSSQPALAGRISPDGATLGVPPYWSEAAAWLDRGSGQGQAALVVPGSAFGTYLWGEPRDEPMQWLARSRWAVRNVIPLTPPGNIRMLDAIEQRLAQGEGSAGLTSYLRRAGIGYLVVRNDLVRANDVPDPVLVHEALSESPGLTRVATFGPDVGGGGHLAGRSGERIVVNGGWQAVWPAVEVFAVAGSVEAAVSSGDPDIVVGGPEDLVDLLDLGTIDETPTRLAADVQGRPDPGARIVLTDGLRARERFFPRLHDGASAVLTPGDVRRSGNPSRDYLIDRDDRWSTTARLLGATAVSASSSMSDADTFGGARRGQLPAAAVDGSSDSQWVSGVGRDQLSWWQLDLSGERPLTEVTVTGGALAADNQELLVRTDTAVSASVSVGPGQTRTIALSGDPTASIRIEDASETPGFRLAIAEVRAPGLSVSRELVLPSLPEDWGNPDTIVLRRDRDARTGCATVRRAVRCAVGRDRGDEEPGGMSRVVTLNQDATWQPRLVVRPLAGPDLDRLILRDQPIDVQATSSGVPDPRASPIAAVDGAMRTSWLADVDDPRPTLTVSWLGTRPVTGVRLRLGKNVAAALPSTVTLSWPGGSRQVALAGGVARFPVIRTDQLQIHVDESDEVTDLGFDAQPTEVPVGIAELKVFGVPYLPLRLSPDERTYGCGSGPLLVAGGRILATRVRAAPADLAAGVAVEGRPCASGPAGETVAGGDPAITLSAGENRVRVVDAAAFGVDAVVLDGPGVRLPTVVAGALERSDAVRRTLAPRDTDALVVLRENANPGWVATRSGDRLTPVTLDGWQQGWLLGDSAAGSVHAEFAPDVAYRAGLAVGLLFAVGLVAVVLLTRRRWAGPVPPALEARRVPRPVGPGLGLLAGGLLGGWTGVAVAAVALGAAWLVLVRAPSWAAWTLAAPCVVAAVGYALEPWGSSTGWAGDQAWTSYVMLVPLVGALLTTSWWPRGRPSRLSRSAGLSTSR